MKRNFAAGLAGILLAGIALAGCSAPTTPAESTSPTTTPSESISPASTPSSQAPEAAPRVMADIIGDVVVPDEATRIATTAHLSVSGVPRAQDREFCREALDAVGMLHLADAPYTRISGGERQLVLIARALAQQTPLIRMDEPTSHLDYRNAATVITVANRLATEQGKAVIMITHLPDQAFYYPSKAALMRDGRFFAYGPSRSVLTEEHLTQTYGMHIKVLTALDPETGAEHVMCKPMLERL